MMFIHPMCIAFSFHYGSPAGATFRRFAAPGSNAMASRQTRNPYSPTVFDIRNPGTCRIFNNNAASNPTYQPHSRPRKILAASNNGISHCTV